MTKQKYAFIVVFINPSYSGSFLLLVVLKMIEITGVVLAVVVLLIVVVCSSPIAWNIKHFV